MTCSHDCDIKKDVVRNQLHFNKHKLHLIDSLVNEKELKDNLFRYVAFDYLLKVHDSEKNNDEFIEGFRNLSNNNRHMNEINALYKGIKNIQPNKKIPNVPVSDFDGNQITLPEIAKNTKTVFYFWSGTDRMHFENIQRRILIWIIGKLYWRIQDLTNRSNIVPQISTNLPRHLSFIL
jgi:hypothetical protein